MQNLRAAEDRLVQGEHYGGAVRGSRVRGIEVLSDVCRSHASILAVWSDPGRWQEGQLPIHSRHACRPCRSRRPWRVRCAPRAPDLADSAAEPDPNPRPGAHKVVVLALDGVYPCELGIPRRVLGSADGRYEVFRTGTSP
ncbi:hypothetical protein GCM10009579_01870 [Streptomyces javensis]|uniref:Uncharacterized protein n=1 Tax=Streptomyces javensis TaxID=114698 RepID=A0ABP4H293_9ACTN